jgi:hypothetical protein
MNRLRKYVEATTSSGDETRTAYAMDLSALPTAAAGAAWRGDESFSAADELLNDPDLKIVFKAALDCGCAILSREPS